MSEYTSNALWPEETGCSDSFGRPMSSDNHRTFDGARAVCEMLVRDGYGGLGEHFPLKTWVRDPDGNETIIFESKIPQNAPNVSIRVSDD